MIFRTRNITTECAIVEIITRICEVDSANPDLTMSQPENSQRKYIAPVKAI